MTFSHVLIGLMEWPEMLMGLELSTMTKHSGFALSPIPAAHQWGTHAPDLQAFTKPCFEVEHLLKDTGPTQTHLTVCSQRLVRISFDLAPCIMHGLKH